MRIRKLYIRIGDIPPNEESGIYRGDRQVGKEIGVSVYNGILIDNTWSIVLPSPLLEGEVHTLYALQWALSQGDRAYLVTGTLVGKGTDGEPLLKNVKIIEDITSHIKGRE